MDAPRPFSPRMIAAWTAFFVVLAVTAQVSGFEFKDGDSRLYARMAHQLADAPFSTWLSPQWPLHYYKDGLFEEHAAVFFWPMALLGVAGVPEVPAALFVNGLYVLGILLCVFGLARRLYGADAAVLSALAWLTSVAGFQYVARANHETALALGVIAAAWALVEAEQRPVFAGVVAVALPWCLLMKGIVGLVALPALAAVAVALGPTRRRLLALLAGTVAMVVVGWGYDAAFEAANGHGFLLSYLDIHLGYAQDRERAGALTKVRNAGYYAGALAWWFLPWSLLLVAAGVRVLRRRDGERDRFLAGVALAAIVHVLFFSVFDRRASRYVFGTYPLFAVAVGPRMLSLTWLRPAWQRVLARPGAALLVAAVVLAGARVYFHLFHHVFYSWNLSNDAGE